MSGLPNLLDGYKNIKKLNNAERERYKKGGLCRRYRRAGYIMFKENKCKLAKQYKNLPINNNNVEVTDDDSGKVEATS